MRAVLSLLATLAVVPALGCSDLSMPPDLDHPQVLAVISTPPAIPAGEASELELVIAGPTGRIEPVETRWRVVEPGPGEAAIGALEPRGEGRAAFRAPAEVAKLALAAVEVTAALDDGSELVAVKGIGVGLPASTQNPAIVSVAIAGQEVAEDATARLPAGTSASLDVVVDPPLGEDGQVSWYATVGEIDKYRRTPSELAALDEPGGGVLFVVVRDGRGGVAYRGIELSVE
jgi:hypothetical protein